MGVQSLAGAVTRGIQTLVEADSWGFQLILFELEGRINPAFTIIKADR
jgi:hypothetical protein